MNIVVVGGGDTNKFGGKLVNKLRQDNHDVKVLSHKSGENISRVNFTDTEDVISKFREVTSEWDRIDIVVYNTSYNSYPNNETAFKSGAKISDKLYKHGLQLHVIVPHTLAIEALNKMDNKSTFIFMTTEMAFDKVRDSHPEMCGYTGGKAFQHQVMSAFAEFNDKEVIFTSISPLFTEDKELCFSRSYDYIINIKEDNNGRVFNCLEKENNGNTD